MRFSTGATRGCHCCLSSSPPVTVCRDSGRRIPAPVCVISYFWGMITGGIATGSWMRRRGGSLIRATSPGITRKHRGSPRSGLRQQNRRGISTSPCRSLCPSPPHLLHPSPLRQLSHRQRHYRPRLHQRQTPRLRSPRALAAN